MAETRVIVGRDGKPDETLTIRINGHDPNFRIATTKISARLFKPVDDMLLDLLDIAASVFAADSTIARGGATRPQFGAGWRRRFDFTIPVRCLELWSRPEVIRTLEDAVRFLTDDTVSFAFIKGRGGVPQQDYFDFAADADPADQIENVILFSGGLDSLAGALEWLATCSGRVALVTHLSAQKLIPHQLRLAEALMTRFPGRILHIPVRATRVKKVAQESTQRSRSFLFAALGHVIARMLGAKTISFYENGIVSHNLPISPQIVGTMATRTTHPLALLKLGAFLDALGGDAIRIENRFGDLTKTEVVKKLAKYDCADLIKDAVSCTKVRDQTILETHCGACSQCLDRRFAILCAGLEEHELDEMYETDVLLGSRSTDRSRTIALDWTSHAFRLSDISFAEFANRHISELTRIIEGHPDIPEIQAAKAAYTLQQRHGREVQEVLKTALRDHADRLLARTLPETSLLRMYVSQQAGRVSLSTVGPSVAPESEVVAQQDGFDVEGATSPIFPLQVAFYVEAGDDWIHVKGLGTVRGRPATVAHALKVFFEEDIAIGRSFDGHRFVQSGLLEFPGSASKEGVRQYVKRCRETLAEYYLAIEGEQPLAPLLIENRPRHGYRLDPKCRVISKDQVR